VTFLAPKVTWVLERKARTNPDARIILVRHRSHATFSRQPRQVRKEATVTGSDVCSEAPVSDFLHQPSLGFVPLITGFYTPFTSLFARKSFPGMLKK
jgi:hypothetical protein